MTTSCTSTGNDQSTSSACGTYAIKFSLSADFTDLPKIEISPFTVGINHNKSNKWALEQWEIRKNLYFDQFDTKIVWDWPQVANMYGASNINVTGSTSWPMGRQRFEEYFKDLGNNVMSVADSKTNQRLTYLMEKDIEDVQFFMKLQKGNVIQNIVRVIVVENL